jgi:hypothetical protein
MTKKRLDFFASLYTEDRKNPLVSPLFADLREMPPSLILAGGDEIMLDDARLLHEKLLQSGNESHLIIGEGLWHAYILYNLKECAQDYADIERFLKKVFPRPRKLRWMRLDNAAKIYPAARRRNWSNVFRQSATLWEDVDTAVLKKALEGTVPRFPSIAARLRKGVFWYYLQQVEAAPALREEYSYPLVYMSRQEMHQCAFRVIAHGRRIAVEFFHSLTDGTGALIFLKSLLAEYLEQRHGIQIPCESGVLDRREPPKKEELEVLVTLGAGDIENFATEITTILKD